MRGNNQCKAFWIAIFQKSCVVLEYTQLLDLVSEVLESGADLCGVVAKALDMLL